MKYIYRILILFAVFVGAVYVMGSNIKEEKIDFTTTVKMGHATLPLCTIEVEGQTINLLHGYSGNLNAGNFRESIIPLESSQTFTVFIEEKEMEIRKIAYELSEVSSEKVIESNSIRALDNVSGGKSAPITISKPLELSKEYALKITVVTKEGKKIHFFSRVKRIEKTNLVPKLEYALGFHQATLKTEDMGEYKSNLEPANGSVNKEDYSVVTQRYPVEMITWGELKPKIITNIIPTIKEIDLDTAGIELSYMIELDSQTKKGAKDLYYVTEYFRVRYTTSHMYLLHYERNMDALFDFSHVDFTKNEMLLGITTDKEFVVKADEDNHQFAFVRNGSLYYYNIKENKAVSVFNFIDDSKETDYIREAYDQHNIKILDLDETGNINFLVYGYMNRGEYEGRLGIILYRYINKDNRIEELAYIPLEQPYEVIEQSLDEFSYLSNYDTFYFSINNVIYSYNIITKITDIIVSDILEDNFIVNRTGHYAAWQNSNEVTKSKEIIILNLETGEKKKVSAPDGENIKILGMIDTNFIYGFGKSSDYTTLKNGMDVLPLYKIEIADINGAVVKDYEIKGRYVTDVNVVDNVIELIRVKKEGEQSFESDISDFIVTKIQKKPEIVSTVLTEKEPYKKQLYVKIPSYFKIKQNPKVKHTINTIIKEDTTVYVSNGESTDLKYYVYAYGHVVSAYKSAGKAIEEANRLMGVVVDHNNQIIFERGRKARNTITQITNQYSEHGVTSVGACLSMMLKCNQITASPLQLSDTKMAPFEILQNNLNDAAINYSGASLESMLYSISKNRPIMAYKSNEDAVLIIGYDEYNVIYIDPSSKKTVKMGLKDATAMFQEAGNIFFGYVN